jgi:hypothetical protein
MRSCSLSVLVHETTEEIASVDSVQPIHASERRPDGRIRWLQPERPVRTVGVVMLHVDAQHLLKVATPRISSQSRHSARTVRIQRSA